ncbi:MAG: hypothetical protein IJA16_05155 [Clostridia bacterium]|nr:hypothetical protein [Clostridia bacterium]
MQQSNSILIENKSFCLKIREDAMAESLIFKPTGEECLAANEEIPFFSVTEDRPYNNEIKLAHPNKRTTFSANRVRREGNKLIVGFELLDFEAVVEIKETDEYISFKLVDFVLPEHVHFGLCMTPPPVAEFRMIQLPIVNKARFGEWLNVMWDDNVCINVLSTSPHARIDSEKRKGYRILTADAVRGIKLKGCEAALIVTSPDTLLDCVEKIEDDYDLPRGVASRRSKHINSSSYWVWELTPKNVDEHIALAKKGGFDMMLVYYSCFFKEEAYKHCNNFEFVPEYPNGKEDVKFVLGKIKDAGMTAGIHFLHPHIGLLSTYVTPVADHRLNLKQYFTLAKPLGLDDTTIYVEENPEGTEMHEKCRVLKFGGELISYESYTTERPYCFKGCVRGHYNTNIIPHELGQIGGLLDISEFCANSVYINQNTSLQDEIADRLAEIYNLGFEFIYYDGSEGTNAPYEFHVPNAQYKVYKKCAKAPLYCEGAAKAHFSWHILSGGNAFDIFPPEIFKESIAKHPLEEAPRMANDFTRLNFGWWTLDTDHQPDMFEYGTSRAAAWDCPITIQARGYAKAFDKAPRFDDDFEVLRRWEDVRRQSWLTPEQKAELRNPNQEHILLINENGEYELAAYDEIKGVASGSEDISAYVFERLGKTYVVCWHKKGSGKLSLPLKAQDIKYEEELGGAVIPVEEADGLAVIPVENRRYLSSELSKEAIVEAFCSAKIIK